MQFDGNLEDFDGSINYDHYSFSLELFIKESLQDKMGTDYLENLYFCIGSRKKFCFNVCIAVTKAHVRGIQNNNICWSITVETFVVVAEKWWYEGKRGLTKFFITRKPHSFQQHSHESVKGNGETTSSCSF